MLKLKQFNSKTIKEIKSSLKDIDQNKNFYSRFQSAKKAIQYLRKDKSTIKVI